MDLTGNEFENIAKVVAAVVGLALVLQTAVGNQIMLITEALKSAFHVKNGSGGVLAIGVAMFTCIALAIVTAVLAVDTGTGGYFAFIAIGAVVGLFVGSGAVAAHKTAGGVNTESSAAILSDREYRAEKAADEELERKNNFANVMALSAAMPRPETTRNENGTFTHSFSPASTPTRRADSGGAQTATANVKIGVDASDALAQLRRAEISLQELTDEKAVVETSDGLRERLSIIANDGFDPLHDVDDLSQVGAAHREQLNDKLLTRGLPNPPTAGMTPVANAV